MADLRQTYKNNCIWPLTKDLSVVFAFTEKYQDFSSTDKCTAGLCIYNLEFYVYKYVYIFRDLSKSLDSQLCSKSHE